MKYILSFSDFVCHVLVSFVFCLQIIDEFENEFWTTVKYIVVLLVPMTPVPCVSPLSYTYFLWVFDLLIIFVCNKYKYIQYTYSIEINKTRPSICQKSSSTSVNCWYSNLQVLNLHKLLPQFIIIRGRITVNSFLSPLRSYSSEFRQKCPPAVGYCPVVNFTTRAQQLLISCVFF